MFRDSDGPRTAHGSKVLVEKKAVLLPQLQSVFMPINKSASSALVTALRDRWARVRQGYRSCWRNEYPEDYAWVAMIREPAERIWSAYKFLRIGKGLSPHSSRKRDWLPDQVSLPDLRLPFPEFVGQLVTWDLNVLDPHLMPQDNYLRPDFEWELIPWDFARFAERFDIDPADMRQENRGRDRAPLVAEEETLALLRDFYAPDYELWERARRG